MNHPADDRAWSRRDRGLWLVLFVVVSCWILGTTYSGGPDEPSHIVAATALMSGQFEGEQIGTGIRARWSEMPSMVGAPDPACWATRPDQPVSCAGAPTSDEEVLRPTTSHGYPPSAWWTMLGRWARLVVVGAAASAIAWAVLRGDRTAEVAAAAVPLVLIGADVVWRRRSRSSSGGRLVISAGLATAAAAVLSLISTLRPGGFVLLHVRLVVGATDDHLESIVGVLGWLDAPSPQVLVLLCWALVGGLVLAALVDEPRSAVLGAGAVAALAVGVFGSWRPWSWDTWRAPIAPVVLIAVHLAATGALGSLVVRAAAPRADRRAARSMAGVAS